MFETQRDTAPGSAIRLTRGGAVTARPPRIVPGDERFVPRIAFGRRAGPGDAPAPVERVAPLDDAAPALTAREKAAFTLRLDPARHERLRQVCAARCRSAQQIVTEALDAFLAATSGPASTRRAAGGAIRIGGL